MRYPEDSAFYRLLATKYDREREAEALEILDANPDLAALEWPGPDHEGQPFVKGSSALHYAANDGKLTLVERLVASGADVNASHANWFRSVLSWAANNARNETIQYLLEHGAQPDSLDAMHAAAWGGSACGRGKATEYAETLRLLFEAGADINDCRHYRDRTPLFVALESGNTGAIDWLRAHGARTS